jgi:two-component system sensor histidine kinase BarA
MPVQFLPRLSLSKISLAVKCRLLFGLAVVLIVASALFVPWLRMRDLVHEGNVRDARQMALLAISRSDLQSPGDWAPRQRALERWWKTGAASLGFEAAAPRLIQINPTDGYVSAAVAEDDFLSQAITLLSARPGLREAPPLVERMDDNNVRYRFVQAVRSAGINPAARPQGTLIGVVSVDYVAPLARFELLTNLGISLMAGALAGVLATLVFYLLTDKLILRPVRELREVAEQVSAGNHDVRSQIATGDEYEDLARAFNAMLAHLDNSRRELEAINRSLDTRLGELAESNVMLFEANKMKSHFLANVSHELRTPLTSIIGFAELLRESQLTQGGRTLRYAENILSSGRLLLAIINDLLDLAKIEAGKLELHILPVCLQDIAESLLDFMQPLAMKKQLTLISDVPPELPRIQSDSGRIQQILYNLLSNAIKFTTEGGRVELRITQLDPGRIKLTVTDTGMGIPQDKLDSIFETFVQLDDSVTREHSGTGLGLPITRELVQLLGGTITAASEVNRGSVFTVILPVEAPGGDKPAKRDATIHISLS